MSKAKTKTTKLAITGDHRVITKDDVSRRAYELFLARGRAEGRHVEDWLEAERQLEADSMASSESRQSRNRPTFVPRSFLP